MASRLTILCVVAAVAAGCGSDKGGGRDSSVPSDGGDGREAAADTGADAPRDTGAPGDAGDGRDSSPEVPGDTGQDRGQDTRTDAGAPDTGGATDATDAPADIRADATADVGVEAPRPDAGPMLVTVQFTGQVVTVAQAPLGFDGTVRTMPVSGSFTYNLRMPDNLPTDPRRGQYLHDGTSAFTFTVGGKTITGSGFGVTEVEDINTTSGNSDTFRFLDGHDNDGITRTMKVDGVDSPALILSIAITDSSGTAWTSDVQPNPFPLTIASTTHTFFLRDGGGTLLMQLDTLTMR